MLIFINVSGKKNGQLVQSLTPTKSIAKPLTANSGVRSKLLPLQGFVLSWIYWLRKNTTKGFVRQEDIFLTFL